MPFRRSCRDLSAVRRYGPPWRTGGRRLPAQGGFAILERNWRSGRYELDIVARRWDELHFIEVKTRRAGGLTTPEEAITPRKFASLRRAAEAYMAQHRVRLEPQFDLAAVDLFPDGSMNVRFTERAMECNW